jgi:hypothetical protein
VQSLFSVVSVVSVLKNETTTEAQRTQRLHREIQPGVYYLI